MFQLTKKTIIFLVVFSCIIVGITIGAIIYTNTHDTSSSSQVIIEGGQSGKTEVKTQLTDDGVPAVTLSDRYTVNDLKISNHNYSPSDDSKVSIQYCQISGLNNESIENSINNEIKDNVFNMYTRTRNK